MRSLVIFIDQVSPLAAKELKAWVQCYIYWLNFHIFSGFPKLTKYNLNLLNSQWTFKKIVSPQKIGPKNLNEYIVLCILDCVGGFGAKYCDVLTLGWPRVRLEPFFSDHYILPGLCNLWQSSSSFLKGDIEKWLQKFM